MLSVSLVCSCSRVRNASVQGEVFSSKASIEFNDLHITSWQELVETVRRKFS